MTGHELDDFDPGLSAQQEHTIRDLAQHAALAGEVNAGAEDAAQEIATLMEELDAAQQMVSALTDERNRLRYRLNQLLPDEYDMPR
jgi:uncharacterized protein involved in exopolysaccharide biosynthesis